METPAVSVVVPAFNAERWIARTIESILNQTFTDLEVIVVIDGATDGTLEICRAFAARDPRIVILEVKNGGVARARNAGLAIARGAFIAPVDADDLWHPTRLALHIDALRRHDDDYAVAYSPHVTINEDDVVGYASQSYHADGYAFAAHLCANFVGNGSGTTVRTAALRAIGGYSPALRDQGGEGCEDYLAQLKLAYLYKFICVPELVIGYRRTEGNMSSNALRMRYSRLLMLDELQDFATGFPHAIFLHPRALAVLSLIWQHVLRSEWRAAGALVSGESRHNLLLPLYAPFVMLDSVRVAVGKLVQRLRRLLGSKAGYIDVPFDTIDVTRLAARPYSPATRGFMWFYDHIEQRIRQREQNGHNHDAWATKPHGDGA